MYGAVLHRQRVLIAAVLYAGYIRRQAYILYPVQQRRVFLINARLCQERIIFFTGTYNAGEPVTHVGIFVGNGMMIHCGNPIQYASIDSSYWSSHFYAFGRLGGG